MSKKKISLAGRPRIKDLRQKTNFDSECVITKKKEEMLQMQETESLPLEFAEKESLPLEFAEKEICFVGSVVSKLKEKHDIWSQPLNRNKYRYSPNQCRQMLLNEIQVLMNDVGQDLFAEGFSIDECKRQCQSFSDEVIAGLRGYGIDIGDIYLTSQDS